MVCLDTEHAGLSPGRCGVPSPFWTSVSRSELGCGGSKGALAVPERLLAAPARPLLMPLLPGNCVRYLQALLCSQSLIPPEME